GIARRGTSHEDAFHRASQPAGGADSRSIGAPRAGAGCKPRHLRAAFSLGTDLPAPVDHQDSESAASPVRRKVSSRHSTRPPRTPFLLKVLVPQTGFQKWNKGYHRDIA